MEALPALPAPSASTSGEATSAASASPDDRRLQVSTAASLPSPPKLTVQSAAKLRAVETSALEATPPDVPLAPGFNLISIPNQPPDSDPAAVLAPITGQYTRILAHDACDPSDPWKVYDPADPAASDLTAIDHKAGLWLDATAPTVLPVSGTQPAATRIELCTGWNLIGYPLAQPRPVPAALASVEGKYERVFGFELTDAADPWEVFSIGVPAWANDLELMRPGRGYWVLVTENAVLDYENVGAAPEIEIVSPLVASEIFGPTDVIATVRSNLLESWTLSYRASGASNAADPFVTVATGNVPIVSSTLGSFDPTLLLNGMYDLRLEAVDYQGRIVETTIPIAVEGKRKVGNFTLSFSDLQVPLSGLDVEVVRTYDSRDKKQRDFGVGWTLDIRQGSYENNRPPGDGWQIVDSAPPSPFPCVGGVETKPHLTTVRLSDQEIYRFRLEVFNTGANLGGCFGQARFAYVDGPTSTATLEILGNTDVLWSSGTDFLFDPITTEVFSPRDVRLITRDGRELDFVLGQGVTRLRDANGNEITITPTSISHSSGASIAITRDAEGRITQIADPMGRIMTYGHDADGNLVAFTDRAGHTTTMTYDDRHGLVDVFDPLGSRAVRSDYDESGRLISTTDALGRTVTFEHDLAAQREIVTNRLGLVRVLEYDDRGNIVREIDEEGGITTRTFDGRDNLLTQIDPVGSVESFTYDHDNNLLSRTDPLGNVETFTYNALGKVLTHTDRRGGVTQNVYDVGGNLLNRTDPESNVTRRSYDSAGNALTHTNGRGFVTTMTYDGFGNLITEEDPLGRTITFAYDANGNRVTEMQSRTVDGVVESLVTTFEYDELGRRIRTVFADGSSTATSFGKSGNVVAATDQIGRVTSYQYDQLNQRIRTTFPDGTSESRAYDAEGRITAVTDREERTTLLSYDGLDRLTNVVRADGSSLENFYDAAGRLISRVDENGNATALAFDAGGNLIREADALGNETLLGYDEIGNLTSFQDADGAVTRFEYDGNGLLVRKTFPDATEETFAYDQIGQPISFTDQAGRQAQMSYDAASEPLAGGGLLPSRLTAVVDTLGEAWTFGYDELGNRISQTDPNGYETRWQIDQLGRVTREILPLGMSKSFVYDAVGNVISQTDFNGDVISLAYDVNGRLIQKSFPDGSEIGFSYSPAGRLAIVTDSRGDTTYTYDTRDRLLKRVDPDGQELSYTYDSAGSVTSVTAPSGTTLYVYDALGRVTGVTDPSGGVTSYSYDALSRLIGIENANGTSTANAYDTLGHVTRVEHRRPDQSIFLSYDYELGPAGHRLRVTENGGRTVQYAYDLTQRLIEEQITDPVLGNETITYTYDSVGNRLSRADSGGLVHYTYDANDRLLTVGDATFAYDANGNVLTRDEAGSLTAFGYDSENRLVSFQGPTTGATYGYDHRGIRISAVRDGTSRHFLIDGNRPLAQVLEERDEAGRLLASYVYGLDLLSQQRDGIASFYHYDGHGTTRALTDEAGEVTDSYAYEAFGGQLEVVGSTVNNYLFAGEQLDPDLGLYYLRARYMDVANGRFLTVDPAAGLEEQPRTLHRYSYALNDPVNLIDPSGEFTFSIPGISVSLSFQGNLRSISVVGGRAALTQARQTLGRVALRNVRESRKLKLRGQQTHHVIEKRLWNNSRELQKIFKHADDIPGINLSPAEHQVFTNAWRSALPYSNQAGHVATPTLEQIITAAQQVYAAEPAIIRAIFLAFL